MKNIVLVTLAFLSISFFSSCNKTPQEMLMGKWKIEKIVNSEEMGDAELEMFNRINKDKIDNEVFYFTIEKLTIKFPEDTDCQWDLSDDGKYLSIYYPEDGEHKYEIVSLDKNELVWKEDFEDFYHVTTLKKVK